MPNLINWKSRRRAEVESAPSLTLSIEGECALWPIRRRRVYRGENNKRLHCQNRAVQSSSTTVTRDLCQYLETNCRKRRSIATREGLQAIGRRTPLTVLSPTKNRETKTTSGWWSCSRQERLSETRRRRRNTITIENCNLFTQMPLVDILSQGRKKFDGRRVEAKAYQDQSTSTHKSLHDTFSVAIIENPHATARLHLAVRQNEESEATEM